MSMNLEVFQCDDLPIAQRLEQAYQSCCFGMSEPTEICMSPNTLKAFVLWKVVNAPADKLLMRWIEKDGQGLEKPNGINFSFVPARLHHAQARVDLSMADGVVAFQGKGPSNTVLKIGVMIPEWSGQPQTAKIGPKKQFSFTVRVDGKEIDSKVIDDPFITSFVQLSGFLVGLKIMFGWLIPEKWLPTVQVSVRGSREAFKVIAMGDYTRQSGPDMAMAAEASKQE